MNVAEWILWKAKGARHSILINPAERPTHILSQSVLQPVFFAASNQADGQAESKSLSVGAGLHSDKRKKKKKRGYWHL